MTTAVAIQDLRYAYPNGAEAHEASWVLRGVDMVVDEGEFLSIVGPTGSGKSTLCLALNGVVPNTTGGRMRGDVSVFGVNTKKHPVAALAKLVGVVFQDPETQLFNMDAEAEVAFGLETMGMPSEEIGERVDWALALMGLREMRDRSPLQLSGGEKQRLAIASVLAMTPKVLVLDEPTNNLDPQGKRDLFTALWDLRQSLGLTVIMVEQETEFVAEFSDRVALMRDGHLEIVGPPATVLGDVERMREIGVAIPQVTEVAYCLNRDFGLGLAFTRFGEALLSLEAKLHES
jgi:energy-coupling factor transport system ATP-binding protein